MTFEDYQTVENMMTAVYAADKLDVTGYNNYWDDISFVKKGNKPGSELTNSCSTINLDGEDRITQIYIDYSMGGIKNMEFQTSKQTSLTLSAPVQSNKDKFAFEGSNYVRFTEGTDLAGLWGTVNSDGFMNSLGFVQRDSVCTQAFLNVLGVENYDWNATKEGAFEVPDTYTDAYKNRVESLNASGANDILETYVVVPVESKPASKGDDSKTRENQAAESYASALGGLKHDHEVVTDTSLVVVTILIWVAILIIILVCIFMYCKMKMQKDQQVRHTSR